jgi:hypothetical protein
MRAVLVSLSLAALVAGGIAGGGLAVESALPSPTATELAKVGAANWFVHDRLVEATLGTSRRPVRAQCMSGSLPVFGHRRLSGADVLVLNGRGAAIDVRGRVQLVTRARERPPEWWVAEMELVGCPGLDAAVLEAAARDRSARVDSSSLAGSPMLAIRLSKRLTGLTIYVRPRTFEPVAVAARTANGITNRWRITLERLTRADAHAILGGVSR